MRKTCLWLIMFLLICVSVTTWTQVPSKAGVWKSAPLLSYVQQGNLQAVREAIGNGADPNAVGPEGYSLVMQAVLWKRKEVVRFLLESGAKAQSPENAGIVSVACRANDLDLVRLLVASGASVNRAENPQSWDSPLVSATVIGNQEMVEFLLKSGAKVDDSDWLGTTSLHIASGKGSVGFALLLVANGADVNRKDNYGRTPLMCACKEGEAETVRFLLEKGADPSLLDAFGRDAARYAIEEAHSPEIAALCSGKK